MLTHICSQTHTLAASEGIQKNYAADNIFIQIYRSICLLHIMFMELGTHVFTVCSFGMRTVVNFLAWLLSFRSQPWDSSLLHLYIKKCRHQFNTIEGTA